jgi:hypothetical protein
LRPAMDLIRKLIARRDMTRIAVQKPGFKLELESYG